MIKVDLHKSLDVVLGRGRDHVDIHKAVSLRSSEGKSLGGTKRSGLKLVETEPEVIEGVLGAGV